MAMNRGRNAQISSGPSVAGTEVPANVETVRGGTILDKTFEEMSRDELLDYLQHQAEAGVRITFSGKDVARRVGRKVQPRSSRRLPQLSVGSPEDQSLNQIIEGENLQAMVTLFRERGQADLILADPPYNTGSDFRYNDRWEEDPNDPGLGRLVPADDMGRHTYWLRFMWPRLSLMRDMLKPSGVLAICIDHREMFHLGQMLDEMFGEQNRLAVINWQKSYTTRGDSGHVATTTEYVLVYAKNEATAKTQLLPRTDAINARYRNPDGDPRLWKSGHSGGPNPETHKSMVYGIQHPFTGEIIYPNERNCWRFGRAEMKRMLEEWGSAYTSKRLNDGLEESGLLIKGSLDAAKKRAFDRLSQGTWPRLFFGEDGLGRPQVKFYLEEVKKGVVPTTYWADEDYDEPLEIGSTSWDYEQSGYTQSGIKELTAIVGPGHNFTTVKPLKLFSKIVQIWCPPNGLVIDPFAGSGTTGHAVLNLNAVTGSERRFILIEQGRPERGDSYARALTAERLSRVVSGDWVAGDATPTGGGFSFSTLQNKVDAKAVLGMERDEMTDAVIASYFDSSRRGAPGLVRLNHKGYQYLVARNAEDEGFYLVWSGPDIQPLFTEEVYEAVVREAIKAKLKPTYHVYARFNLYQSDDVRFYQIPDRILMNFGLNTSSDAFHNEDNEE